MNRHLERLKRELEAEKRTGKTRNRPTFLLIVLFLAVGFMLSSSLNSPGKQAPPEAEGGSAIAEQSQSAPQANESTEPALPTPSPEPLPNPADYWNVILVNREHPLPEDFAVTLTDVPGGQVDERIAPALLQMIADAAAAGVTLDICSGYRDLALQARLYENNLSSYLSQGYGEEESHQLAARYVQPSGMSEHHTGLAVDFFTPDYTNLTEEFAKSSAYEWLQKHAAAYGFIERYGKDKEAITGIAWEPWHYRYVGSETADEILSSGLTFEEYVDGLRQRATGS